MPPPPPFPWKSGAPLPPAEQDRLAAAMQSALAALSPGQQRMATMTGRTQPISDTVASALRGGSLPDMIDRDAKAIAGGS